FEIEIRRIAGSVRQRSHVGDGSNKAFETTVVAAEVEDFLDDGAVLLFQLVRLGWSGDDVRAFFDIHAKPAIRIGLSRARDTAMQSLDRDGKSSSRQLDALGHFRDDSDLCI